MAEENVEGAKPHLTRQAELSVKETFIQHADPHAVKTRDQLAQEGYELRERLVGLVARVAEKAGEMGLHHGTSISERLQAHLHSHAPGAAQ